MLNQDMYAYGRESSVIREIFSYANERKARIGEENVFDFSLGNPSVPAPAAVREAILAAMELPPAEVHGYTPAPGLPSTRAAIADSLNRRFGCAYTADNVFMTVGAAASVSCAIHAVARPGDEVVVIAPYFPEYRVWIETAGATVVEVPADPATFQIDAEAVRRAITSRTAAVIIDSPNNPTGAVYTRENLMALAAVLEEANAARASEASEDASSADALADTSIILISDEPYRELTYGAEVPWVPSVYAHTVVCYSYSKSLSLPGERIGWVLVPPQGGDERGAELGRAIMAGVAGAARALGFVCAPALFQRVVEACVDEPADVAAYARNRELLCRALDEYGYTYVEPDGAFYLWVRALEPDAEAFCERARAYELLPVPSNSFGVTGWVRVGYCVAPQVIERSLPAWKALAEEYRNH